MIAASLLVLLGTAYLLPASVEANKQVSNNISTDITQLCVSGLKPGRVIRVNRVTFCPGQVGLTRFIKYLGLTWILLCITCVVDGVWPW